MRHARLSLKREALAPLGATEMANVVGGSHFCGTDPVTHGYTFDACAAPTLPVNECIANITSAIVVSGSNCVCAV